MTTIQGLGVLAVLAAAPPTAKAPAVARTVFDVASPQRIPEGAPKASDVLMRSLTKRSRKAGSPHDTMQALSDFHVTQLVWAYITDKPFIAAVKAGGRVFGGAAAAPSYVKPPDDATWFEKVVIVDVEGKPIIAPWKRAWKRTLWGCINNAELERGYVEYLKRYIDAGARIMQRDEPDANASAVRWGGCFCEHCMAAFGAWLGEHTKPDDRKRLGITDLATFDYGKHLKRIGAPVGDAFGRWNGGELKRLFFEFQTEATVAFHQRTRKAIDAYAGRRVPFSCNNGVRAWGPIQLEFDWAFGELSYSHAAPVYLYNAMKQASEHGRLQVVTMPKTSKWQTTDDLVARTRRTIAMATACGGQAMVPWDTYMPGDTPRYFGKAEQYADLYAFIRGCARYLDGYAEACASGRGLAESRYGDRLPIKVTGGGDAYAVTRVRPREAGSPVAVHVVDWSDKPEPTTVVLDPACLFGPKAMKLTLFVPQPYDAAAHRRAAEGGRYEDLVKRVALEGGCVTVAKLPAVSPWGILVIEPDPDAVPGVFAPSVAPFGGAFVGRQVVSLQTVTPGARVRYTLDGSEPTPESRQYDGPFAVNESTTVKARAFVGDLSSTVAQATFTALEGRQPEAPAHVKPGLRHEYFESGCDCDQDKSRNDPCPKCWLKLPDFDALEPIRSGVCEQFDFAFENKGRRKWGNFGYRFSGYVRVPRDGLYTFATRSDDGVRLSIGKEALIFHDGLHGPEEQEKVAPLRAGLHAIQVDYFEGYGGQSLEVLWRGPGVEKAAIPAEALCHAPVR